MAAGGCVCLGVERSFVLFLRLNSGAGVKTQSLHKYRPLGTLPPKITTSRELLLHLSRTHCQAVALGLPAAHMAAEERPLGGGLFVEARPTEALQHAPKRWFLQDVAGIFLETIKLSRVLYVKLHGFHQAAPLILVCWVQTASDSGSLCA